MASHKHGSQRELADKVQINPATISRWLDDEIDARPSAEQVIRFARGVGESPIQALVMAGYVSPDEARMEVKDLTLSDLSEVVLLSELLSRARGR